MFYKGSITEKIKEYSDLKDAQRENTSLLHELTDKVEKWREDAVATANSCLRSALIDEYLKPVKKIVDTLKECCDNSRYFGENSTAGWALNMDEFKLVIPENIKELMIAELERYERFYAEHDINASKAKKYIKEDIETFNGEISVLKLNPKMHSTLNTRYSAIDWQDDRLFNIFFEVTSKEIVSKISAPYTAERTQSTINKEVDAIVAEVGKHIEEYMQKNEETINEILNDAIKDMSGQIDSMAKEIDHLEGMLYADGEKPERDDEEDIFIV